VGEPIGRNFGAGLAVVFGCIWLAARRAPPGAFPAR
jgi:hypothetical protein